MPTTSPLVSMTGPPCPGGPTAASSWISPDDTSLTKPWLMEPPEPPRPDTAKTRSPMCRSLLEKLSFGRLGRLTISKARSLDVSHVHSVARRSSDPLRTKMAGAGLWVDACTVLNDVTSSDWLLSEATTNAEPTAGWPALSRVCTNHTAGCALLRASDICDPTACCLSSGAMVCWIWD